MLKGNLNEGTTLTNGNLLRKEIKKQTGNNATQENMKYGKSGKYASETDKSEKNKGVLKRQI